MPARLQAHCLLRIGHPQGAPLHGNMNPFYRPDDKVIEPGKEDFTGKGHVLLATRLGPLDVLSSIEEGKGYEDLINHTVEIEFKGRLIRVLALEKMVDLKERSNNPLVKQHLPILKEVLRQLQKK